MVWHKHNISTDGFIYGPQDGEAWRHVNGTFPYFGDDPRLAISMDGVHPERPTSIGSLNMANHSCHLQLATVAIYKTCTHHVIYNSVLEQSRV